MVVELNQWYANIIFYYTVLSVKMVVILAETCPSILL